MESVSTSDCTKKAYCSNACPSGTHLKPYQYQQASVTVYLDDMNNRVWLHVTKHGQQPVFDETLGLLCKLLKRVRVLMWQKVHRGRSIRRCGLLSRDNMQEVKHVSWSVQVMQCPLQGLLALCCGVDREQYFPAGRRRFRLLVPCCHSWFKLCSVT